MIPTKPTNKWDEQLPHVEFSHTNSVRVSTGSAPNKVHRSRIPHLPLTIFDCTRVAGHQSLARDDLAYCDLATDRPQRAYDIVREHHALPVARVERRNSSFRRTASGSRIRRWRLGVSVQYGCHHLSRHEGGHRPQRSQGQTLAQLDGPLQSPRSWPLYPR